MTEEGDLHQLGGLGFPTLPPVPHLPELNIQEHVPLLGHEGLVGLEEEAKNPILTGLEPQVRHHPKK